MQVHACVRARWRGRAAAAARKSQRQKGNYSREKNLRTLHACLPIWITFRTLVHGAIYVRPRPLFRPPSLAPPTRVICVTLLSSPLELPGRGRTSRTPPRAPKPVTGTGRVEAGGPTGGWAFARESDSGLLLSEGRRPNPAGASVLAAKPDGRGGIGWGHARLGRRGPHWSMLGSTCFLSRAATVGFRTPSGIWTADMRSAMGFARAALCGVVLVPATALADKPASPPGQSKRPPLPPGAGGHGQGTAGRTELPVPAVGGGTGSPTSAVVLAAWLDDAETLAPGAATIGLSIGRSESLDGGETDAPVFNAAVGVSSRLQLSGSLPFYWASYNDGYQASGRGNTYVAAKVKVADPNQHSVGIAVAPVLDILSDAALSDTTLGLSRVDL